MTMIVRHVIAFIGLFTVLIPTWSLAKTPALLDHAVENWIAGKQEVAFTQRARTFEDDGKIKEERIERYDPSLPDDRRWRLLEINGWSPTEEQRQAIEYRKNRKPRKHANKSPKEFLDFPNAIIRVSTPESVTYEVSLRPDAARLVQTENLIVLITVGRESQTIERVMATLIEPMRVALGLAKITDVELDLIFDSPEDAVGDEQPSGTARVSLSKFGKRMDYEWWDFMRSDPYEN